ncbi:MAG: MotA/TolQ/ExbB proton channel family protein [Planctomycetes bacterium]|nr:MotA/TolQ/ExbB proton channel family protein [Planctomycetota bacterium]
MNPIARTFRTVTRSSLLWGGLASIGFYALLHAGKLNSGYMDVYRYFANHWVLYVETILFFVGVSELVIKAFDLAEQRGRLKTSLLGPLPAEPLPAPEAANVLAELCVRPFAQLQGYFPERLRAALETILRHGSADKLEDELKYLSEGDSARAHGSYALMRFIIWAIPILGFLGTVIGITLAIASLNPKALETSLDEVTAGLGVAFDTTALALALSMTLMLGQFLIDKFEQKLLGDIDGRMLEELAGRFASTAVVHDPHLAAVQRMSELVLLRTESLVQKQVELWQQSLTSAESRWGNMTGDVARQITDGLNEGLAQNVRQHAEHLVTAEAAATEANRRRWHRIHRAVAQQVDSLQHQQSQLSHQTEMLTRIVDASNLVARLEKTLNHNLASLAGSQHLQETLLSLSSAIALLNARLGQVLPTGPHIDLHDSTRSAVPAPHLRADGLEKNSGKVA